MQPEGFNAGRLEEFVGYSNSNSVYPFLLTTDYSLLTDVGFALTPDGVPDISPGSPRPGVRLSMGHDPGGVEAESATRAGSYSLIRIRWCRCARPPANVWHPSGMANAIRNSCYTGSKTYPCKLLSSPCRSAARSVFCGLSRGHWHQLRARNDERLHVSVAGLQLSKVEAQKAV
jgi:hypothetical protein